MGRKGRRRKWEEREGKRDGEMGEEGGKGRKGRRRKGWSYLAVEVVGQQDIPGSKVSVNKALFGKVAHPSRNVLGELDEENGQRLWNLSLAVTGDVTYTYNNMSDIHIIILAEAVAISIVCTSQQAANKMVHVIASANDFDIAHFGWIFYRKLLRSPLSMYSSTTNT